LAASALDPRYYEALQFTAFSAVPFKSLPLLAPAPESPLGEGFRTLIVLPPAPPAKPATIDPRSVRALMDRGVVIFANAAASASGDAQRQKGAELIQAAGLLGFVPARALRVRNFPQSEPLRRAVPRPT